MTLLVNDLAVHTNEKMQKLQIQTVGDIYAHDGRIALFSDSVYHMAMQLKDYLYDHFYNADEVMKYNEEGKTILVHLFRALYDEPGHLPQKYQLQLEREERYICGERLYCRHDG